MQPSAPTLLLHSLFALCVATGGAGCASDVDLGTRPQPMGQTGGTGASDQNMNATGGSPDGSGGRPTMTGGEPDATGGDPAMTGGSMNATGGSPAATGGNPSATGGAPAMGFCGDGVVNRGEGCDDGNVEGGDGCSSECTVEIGWRCEPPGAPCINFPNCGNGVVDDGEACDDGKLNDGAYGGCNTDCTLAPYCGDGVIQMDHEQCDPGMNFAGNGCTADCQLG